VNNYVAGDGRAFWLVGLEGPRHWPALARAVGRPEWLEDERFADPRSRATNAEALIVELDAIFATRPLEEWAAVFEGEPELFWSPVNSIDDLLVDEQFWASGAVVQVADEEGAWAELATPADFGGSAPVPRSRAPRLGQHTREVLAELDYDAASIEDLLAGGTATQG
jgi:crotonobetainyl-CoA:carnitine CoA-transferase CaiB-like acyl-CoA transferase